MRTKFLHTLLRNPTVLLAPLILVGILLTPLAGKFTPVAIWNDRSYDVLSLLFILGPFVAAVGAWEGARAARLRKLHAQRGATWAEKGTTWAKTAVWGLLLYLLVCAGVFLITATQATWGGPLFGPPLVGAVAILSLSAVGFTIGDRWSRRVAGPVIGVSLLAAGLGLQPDLSSGLAVSVWYNVRSDLVIVQLTFLLGLLAIALASLGIGRSITSSTVWPRVLAVCGVVLMLASFAGVASSSTDIHGVRVPLLYHADEDRPISYTPVCHQAALPVCVHPAYSAELSPLSALINRVAAPLIGVPGAPILADQRPTAGDGWQVVGNVLVVPPFAAHAADWANPSFRSRESTQIAIGLVRDTLGGRPPSLTTTQQAIALYLLQQASMSADPNIVQISPQAREFEQQFAAQSEPLQRGWLIQHYSALLQGS